MNQAAPCQLRPANLKQWAGKMRGQLAGGETAAQLAIAVAHMGATVANPKTLNLAAERSQPKRVRSLI
jgi:hypothetical protein